MADIQSQSDQSDSRPPSLSETASEAASDQPSISSTSTSPPPTPHDIDRWNQHITLQEFGAGLQGAARALFPNERTSRYTCVTVLVLSWEDEDPKLPVSLEIAQLVHVFKDIYHYDVDEWRIPMKNSHWALNHKIMSFVEPAPNDREHLKIVYYAGHGRLTKTKLLEWTSSRENPKLHSQSRLQPVQWSGIQILLEQAESDVLILLDCCAAGTANAGGGSGVTELIAACSYSGTANGVGRYSFTNALVTELHELSQRPSFSTGELYRNVFLHAQCHSEHGRDRPAPVHLPLTKQSSFPRSIQLSILSRPTCDPMSCEDPPKAPGDSRQDKQKNGPEHDPKTDFQSAIPSLDLTPISLTESFVPRLLFAVRLKESFQPNELSTDMLTEWFRMIPLIGVEEVKIEAGFNSFSSVVILSVPIAMSAFIPTHPAVFCLGPITSRNVFPKATKPTSLPINASMNMAVTSNLPAVLRWDGTSVNSRGVKKRKARAWSSSWAKLRRSSSKPSQGPLSTPSLPSGRSEGPGPLTEKVGNYEVTTKHSSQSGFCAEMNSLKQSFGNEWQPPVDTVPIMVFRQVGDTNHDMVLRDVLEGAFKEKQAPDLFPWKSANRSVTLGSDTGGNTKKDVALPDGRQSSSGSNLIELDDLNSQGRASTRGGISDGGSKRSLSLQSQIGKRAATIFGGCCTTATKSTTSTSLDWINSFVPHLPTKPSSQPEAPSSFSAAQETFIFAVMGVHDQLAVPRIAWSWYIDFLLARIHEAWVPLFRQVLRGIDLHSYYPCESEIALAMRFLTSVVVELRKNDLALVDVVEGLYNQGILDDTDGERSNANQLVFAAIGWLTLLYSPNIHGDRRQFKLRSPSNDFASEHTLASKAHGMPRTKNKRRYGKTIAIRAYEQSMEYFDQPLITLLRRFGTIIPQPVVEPTERFEIAGTRYSDCIEASLVSFYTLHKGANIHIQWVDNLCQHLEYDHQSKSLSIFRFPTICLIMKKAQDSGPLAQLFRDAQSDWSDSADASGYFQEVLLSYRLIFGMDKSSYKAFNRLEWQAHQGQDVTYDPLLNTICGQSCQSSEVVQIFGDCDIDDPRMRYNSKTDFPFLGDRLMRLQEYSRCHYPRSVAEMWHDRRDYQRWWTFWIACSILGLTLVFGSIQIVIGSFQVYYALHPV
ncbi:hypothetical protein IFR05_006708 [Cadophora sp. M221]|nr:hypothetical protein IFR05_006708 [Cadophora sp. M221]